MKNIIISTDNTCDMTSQMLEQRNILTSKLSYYLDGVEQDNTKPFDGQQYFTAMDNGAIASTSLCNQTVAEEHFTMLLEQGKDIVHMCFTSGCSGTYDNAVKAAEAVNAQSNNKVYVIDSLCGSGGLALLVTMADDYANTGKTAVQVRDYVESIKLNICHFFCLDTVKHLVHGGRISKLAGWIGTAINIRPFMNCDDQGKLVVLSKMFSRKKSLMALIDGTANKYNDMSDRMYVCHANCQDDAQYVADGIYKAIGVQPIILPLGPVIGSHGGTGAMAVFFTGHDRQKPKAVASCIFGSHGATVQ